MSWLSVGLNDLKAFFTAAAANAPAAAQTSINTAQTQLAAAQTAAENAIPALADGAVNAVLNFIPGGAAYAPLADAFIDQVIAGLQAKKSNAPASTGS